MESDLATASTWPLVAIPGSAVEDTLIAAGAADAAIAVSISAAEMAAPSRTSGEIRDRAHSCIGPP